MRKCDRCGFESISPKRALCKKCGNSLGEDLKGSHKTPKVKEGK